MKTIKFAIAAAIIAGQPIVPVLFLSESLLRGLGVPYFSIGLMCSVLLCQLLMKDKLGGKLFSLERLTRLGPIGYYSFDVLKHLD
jgi:hypothetical protein